MPKTTPHSRSSSDAPEWKKAEASQSDAAQAVARVERSEIRGRSCGFHCRSRTAAPGFRFAQPELRKEQGSRTPTDAVRNRLPFGKRAPCRARSPVGVPRRFLSKGLTHPEDSASDQASRSAAPIGGGGIPPASAPVTASTSHAGHCAGRLMSETARAQRRRNPARGHRNSLPPAGVTGRRPCTKSERIRLIFLVSGLVNIFLHKGDNAKHR